ncbi:AbrB/MazE/SpoVT family DNA-binding domain-containing protein [Rhizobium leucaenae]|uniref:AbrB family looped-hinge helix DNA binding protein n=1 Tax=Rhizobium leucaenae TaxID=29450 RepID=A0A7W7EI46_9HYPH|nr:type II toxin-antitoxin system PrlF family antitoxin [Rhizobium leucaenae]MBB4566386.1 AbrB family looped-hinge helix DNA binding protein [Rhizobium leucaenae]MBB6304521.1 AbrB family looped-hinge helix DNA binding protein [Rhizobium leucaenae]
MTVFYGTMTSKGQTTVPAEVRDILKLKPGDKIRYVHRNGEIIMKAKNKRAIDLAGKFYDPHRAPITVEEMDDVIGDAIVEHVLGKE